MCRCCYAAATPGGCSSPLTAYVVQRLLWLPRVVVVCAYVGATTSSHGPKPANLPCQLLLYPRYHLDHSSLLARYPLPQVSPLLSTTLHPSGLTACTPHNVLLSMSGDMCLTPVSGMSPTVCIRKQPSIGPSITYNSLSPAYSWAQSHMDTV